VRTVRIDLSPERISAVALETGVEWSAPASVAVTLNEKGAMVVVAVGEYEHDAEIEHAKAVFDPEGEEIRRVLPFPAAWPKSASPLVSVEELPPIHPGAAAPELGPKDVMLCWVLRPNTIDVVLIEAMTLWAVVMVLQDTSVWPLSWRARVEIHWPGFDRLPTHARDAFVRLRWGAYGRSVVVNGRPTNIRQISNAIHRYYAIRGQFPPERDWFNELVRAGEFDVASKNEDPWGHPYVYERVGDEFNVTSSGADGVLGTRSPHLHHHLDPAIRLPDLLRRVPQASTNEPAHLCVEQGKDRVGPDVGWDGSNGP